jgi:NSS family neurotransmitter:Na+ symporter
MTASAQHGQWSSKTAFLFASVGFAVGLGNIWRFPYVTGENGGAAFVLVYLACVIVIGVPILMAEILIGRRGRMSPPGSMREVAIQEGRSPRWQLVGHMSLLAAFLIEIVYAVIAGWVLWYLFKAIVYGYVGVDATVAETTFATVLTDTLGMLFWTVLGLAITGFIIFSGLKKGIERAVIILMPLLFLLLIALVIFNMFLGGFTEALTWLFTPDWSKITPAVFLAAIGQAFFSIGVAMAGQMTYGAYLPKQISIGQSVLTIVAADTLVAILAGLVIFPAVFHHGLDPAAGPGLIFQTLPVAFAQMPGGHVFGILFFLLLSVAAITSMVGLIEPITAWLEEHHGFARHKSAVAVVGVIATLSVFSILSYNVLGDIQVLGKNLNDAIDYFSNQILLPLGGLFIAIFAGWLIKKRSLQDELNMSHQGLFTVWHCLIRYVAPLAVFIIFVMGVSG